MSRSDDGVPRPGFLAGSIIRIRLAPDQWRQLLAELLELHEHRTATSGRSAADRWLRREYRRLATRLLMGARLEGVPSSIGTGSRATADFVLDLRQSIAGLARVPVFTATVVATVGLGIGGTSLVFAIVHAVLIAPLPYPGGDRMVMLRTVEGEQMWGTSMADLHALFETPPAAFDGLAAYSRSTRRVAAGPEVELIPTKSVTPGYFPLIGHDPIAGRHFGDDEGRPGAAPAVLVTEAFRLRSFAAGTDVLGRSILVDGEPHTIVGVLPDRLGPLDRDIEVFPALVVDLPPRKGPFFYPSLARLREGTDPATARAQLEAVSDRIFPIWQDSFTQRSAILGFIDLKQAVIGDVGPTLLIVLTAVAFLLVIGSANASSLLVARGVTRMREMAVRSALGASSARIGRLLLTEALVIATVAAGLGLAITMAGLNTVRRLGVGHLPRIDEVGMGPEAVAFLLSVVTASWLLFGLVASGTMARTGTSWIASSSGRATPGRGMLLLRRVLAASQFAVTVPLLVGAALLIESLGQIERESYGFDPEGVVSMLVTLPEERFSNADDVRAFWSTTLPEIEALPGVIAAGLADARPPEPISGGNNFVLADRPVRPGEPASVAPWITADAGFFRTLGLRVAEGRIYDPVPADTMRHAVVDESWVEQFHPEGSPIGRRFRSGGCTVDGCPWVEIVGVVSDVKTAGLDDTRRLGTMYYDFARDSYSSIRLHLRAQDDPLGVVPAVRAAIQAGGGGIVVGDVRTVRDLATESLAGRRYTSTLVALLAGIALLLSLVGIYGVMAYYVRQHVRDIGIRIALGGGPSNALRLVLQRGMAVAGLGTLLGLAVTPVLTRPLAGLLYGVAPGDPRVLTIVTVGTLAVALGATALPGRRAARTDPAVTLREE